MAELPVKIRSAPGIKRDGTVLEGENYIDGQWFYMYDEEPLDMEYEVTHYMLLPEAPT